MTIINVQEYIKKNFLLILVIVIVIVGYFRGCFPGISERPPKPSVDTQTHTIQVPQPIVINPPYTPQQQGNTVFPINIPSQYNASGDIAKLQEQYNELVKQFLASKTYSDSIQLKDTSGNRVGVVSLNQLVSENTLKSTRSSYQLSFPHTTTTITINQPYKPKNQVYIGAELGGSINGIFNQADIGAFFKNKRDNMLGLSVGYNFSQNTEQFKLKYYHKLSFKK